MRRLDIDVIHFGEFHLDLCDFGLMKTTTYFCSEVSYNTNIVTKSKNEISVPTPYRSFIGTRMHLLWLHELNFGIAFPHLVDF